jgi:hypothetical protein
LSCIIHEKICVSCFWNVADAEATDYEPCDEGAEPYEYRGHKIATFRDKTRHETAELSCGIRVAMVEQ